MYDMQISSYDANLSFFMDEFIIENANECP